MTQRNGERETTFVFSDARLKALREPGKYTDEGCPRLRIVLKNGKLAFEIRWRNAKGKQEAMVIGHFIVPVPQRGEPMFAKHMRIKDARSKANKLLEEWHQLGINPRQERSSKPMGRLILREDMEAFIALKLEGGAWSRPEIRATQIRQNLERHCKDLLDRPTISIKTEDIAATLRAIRKRRPEHEFKKPVTMVAMFHWVRGMLREIFEMTMGGKTKARWPANVRNPVGDLEHYLTIPEYRTTPRKSMPVTGDLQRMGVADFYAHLCEYQRRRRSCSAPALRFLLLTCAPRSREVRLATWEQMHLDQANPEWWVPDENMKIHKVRPNEVRVVPLSYVAVAFLRDMMPLDAKPTDYVFQGTKGKVGVLGRPIHEHTMLTWQHAQGIEEETVHGYRGTLLGYTMETHPELVFAAQIALDHNIFKSVTDTYLHTTLPVHRRLLAEYWGEFLESKLPEALRTPRPVTMRRITYEKPPSEWPTTLFSRDY